MITRTSLADTIDAYDEQIADLNKSKRETFDAYRDQMVAARLTKPEIKAEIEAVKAAIKRRRESVKDQHALIEKDELIDEVFREITRAPRATRVATTVPSHDPHTGEVLEDEEISRPATLAVSGGEPSIPSTDAGGEKMDGCNHPGRSDEPSGHICAQSEQATDTNSQKAAVATQGEATAPTSGERVSPDEGGSAAANAGGHDVDRSGSPATHLVTGEGTALSALPAKPQSRLRPNCLEPTMCRSGTRDHCYSCRKAMEREDAA